VPDPSRILGQRNRELGHVANLIGGFVRNNLWYPQGMKVFTPVPAEQQKNAVQFLIEHGSRTPPLLIAPDILDRFEAQGSTERVLSAQRMLLRSLENKRRLDRISGLATRTPKDAYTPADLIDDLTDGIWAERKAQPIEIDVYRRNLRRAYVDLLAGFLDNRPTTATSPPWPATSWTNSRSASRRYLPASSPARSPARTCRTSRPAPITRWMRSRRHPRRSVRPLCCRSAAAAMRPLSPAERGRFRPGCTDLLAPGGARVAGPLRGAGSARSTAAPRKGREFATVGEPPGELMQTGFGRGVSS
jgi:hypothetical protein